MMSPLSPTKQLRLSIQKYIEDYAQLYPLLVWIPFLLMLTWRWQSNVFTTIPSYGDALEMIWGTIWYGQNLQNGLSLPAIYPLIFHPEGWYVATFANGLGLFLLLVPFYLLAGAAFAYNIVALLSLFIAYAGMYKLSRLFTSRFASVIAALLFTFWGFRWARIYGHLNILVASSMLPWLIWSLDHALTTTHRRKIWVVLTAVFWAYSISCSFYFIWIGAVVSLGWSLGKWINQGSWHRSLSVLIGTSITAFIFSAPFILRFYKSQKLVSAAPYTIEQINRWGASLNILLLPFLGHPFFGKVVSSLYQGRSVESIVVGLGTVALFVALSSVFFLRKNREIYPAVLLMVFGFILSLGLTLQWNDQSIQAASFAPINSVIWQIGHAIKPALFNTLQPPPTLETTIPLPSLLISAIVPFWESARVMSRYVLIAGIGVFLLVAFLLDRISNLWAAALLSLLLIIEIVPPAITGYSFPPPEHQAFTWLKEQDLGDKGIIDLRAISIDTFYMPIEGTILYATLEHNQPTAAGASSVIPAHTVYLQTWLSQHPDPLHQPDFPALLQFYDIQLLAVHMQNRLEQTIFHDLPNFNLIQCFPPPESRSPWSTPICILEVLPSENHYTNVMLGYGWSPPEPWGIWAMGEATRFSWVATNQHDYQLSINAFPHCLQTESQQIKIFVNGQKFSEYQWQDCEEWTTKIPIPFDLVEIGHNEIYMTFQYGIAPADISDSGNLDARRLAVGFTELLITNSK